MKGRKRKPLERHLIEGTYREYRHGPLTPAVPLVSPVPVLGSEPPARLDEYAREVWTRLHGPLTASGVLTDAERDLFSLFCMSVGVANRAYDRIASEGYFVKLKRDHDDGRKAGEDSEIVSPWVRLFQQFSADAARMASQLGLTPVDRSRVMRATATPGVPAVLPTVRPLTALDRLYRGMRPADEA